MKTLDEVIKALEICSTHQRCTDGCPYYRNECPLYEMEKDALHYLREYYETKKHLACLDDAEIRGDNTQVVNNQPLTWDELKTMEGKPVWVEGSAFANGHWSILDGCYENGGAEYVFIDGDQYWKEDMKDADDGVSWQAYRKER